MRNIHKMKNINNRILMSKQKFKEVPFRKLVPNMLTMMALCSGVTSIRYAISDDWVKAVLCIFLAALFDGLDGRVARFLKASSKFGAELDSLSDFVSFGVAPAILIYQWTLFDLPKFGWFFCLLFAMGMAMRLARFNTMLEADDQPEYWSHYFVGVPAPAAAALAMMPILICFHFPQAADVLQSNAFCGILMFIIAFLMVSRIPTISLKKLKVQTYMMLPLMLFVVLFIHFMITQPWLTLGIMTGIYALTIPLGVVKFLYDKKKSKADALK